jgi:N-acetylglucosaminyldiphosphoundecaprenol N-acetyl-beta-D-mannosaminyltransferase
MQTSNVLGTKITLGSRNQFIDTIIELGQNHQSAYGCFANVHMVVEAQRNPTFSKIVNTANLVAPDGRPLSLFLKLFKGIGQSQMAGPEIMPEILKSAAQKGVRVYFYGSTNKVLQKLILRASHEFPDLQIAGVLSPPFRTLTEVERKEHIDIINKSGAQIVFVALGCPKQEKWMADHRGKIHACMLGVGQALPIYGGDLKRAPLWIQKLSMEWLFRIYLEPRRLWKRYLVTNTLFLYYILKNLLVNRD